ncbi:hypothetical protein FGU65_12830 [Methanoculleus sp. FWC-SCC1]|uniref:Uncharacterized protein n=1 Tax=Methanoculleus frigidifontis TaxID=2584085 RepID=A0ABT8MCU5_9EURY|nr:hypothetical protein [Methanoculleus sp. FWC-SCC1]MDN7025753.1 hypothetical protein [Methanoculleus sp. FWC-SCC1]
MDDVIEQGYTRLVEAIRETADEKEKLAGEVREQKAALLTRMAAEAAPLVPQIGLSMLNRARIDSNKELYDPEYYPEKMILLGKTEPMPYRPDDMTKRVDTQVCVLSEDGSLFELMYSSTEIRVDSYREKLAPDAALDLYSSEILFMLYRAMRECLQNERELLDALAKTLEYIAAE